MFSKGRAGFDDPGPAVFDLSFELTRVSSQQSPKEKRNIEFKDFYSYSLIIQQKFRFIETLGLILSLSFSLFSPLFLSLSLCDRKIQVSKEIFN